MGGCCSWSGRSRAGSAGHGSRVASLADEGLRPCRSAPVIANKAATDSQLIIALDHRSLRVPGMMMAQEMLIALAFRKKRQQAISSEASHLPLPQPYQHAGQAVLFPRRPNRAFNVYSALRYFSIAKRITSVRMRSRARQWLVAASVDDGRTVVRRCQQSAGPATRMAIGRIVCATNRTIYWAGHVGCASDLH